MPVLSCVLTVGSFLRKALLFVMFRRICGGINCIHSVMAAGSQL